MDKPPVKVVAVGFPDPDQRRLQAAFTHSKTRGTSYANCEIQDHDADIFIVNADEPQHLDLWQSYKNEQLTSGNNKVPPVVMAHKNRDFSTQHYHIRRPLIASRVICILDQVVVDKLKTGVDTSIFIDTGADFINLTETSPIEVSHTQHSETQHPQETQEPPDDEKALAKVLVVDDSLPVRIQMAQALEQFSTDVDFAETGEGAFEYLDNNEYDVIFLDVVLPGIDGYEICSTIKKGKAKDTPVIMLTGNASPEDKIKGKLAGCDTYLIKPVGRMIFQEVVNRYLYKQSNTNMI